MKKTIFVFNIKKYLVQNKLFLSLYFILLKRKTYYKSIIHLRNKNGVEIGGPSTIFSRNNAIPVYSIINSLDNVNFSSNNFWSKIKEGDYFQYDNLKSPGRQIIADAIDLSIIEDEKYEFLLSSLVLEHVANPIKALYEWKRILTKKGILLIVIPNKRFTYDKFRPLTKFDHIIDDYEKNVLENDQTHFDEIIRLHDLTSDTTVNSFQDHKKRTLDNFNTRIAHHHTFDMNLMSALITYCGFNCLSKEEFKHHLIILAEKL